jgi:hypothetical protein
MTVEEFKKLTDIHQKMIIFEDAADTLKRCIKEDSVPCIQFGNSFTISKLSRFEKDLDFKYLMDKILEEVEFLRDQYKKEFEEFALL